MPALRVLIGCECSGVVRRAFRERGHDAWSCDIEPADDGDPNHIQDDIRVVLKFMEIKCIRSFDLAIFHPPCTYVASSGLHWNKRVPGRAEKTEDSLRFIRRMLDADIHKIALENPIGCISSRIRKPDQIIQPWMFGEDASKATCLWLKNLPKLVPTNIIKKERYANQTPSGQNKLGPSPERAKLRSETYRGIAEAMAEQWGA